MTRKKSNVKALALAVTCAILAGGGIGLEPVYAADVLYKETSGNVTTAAKNGEIGNTIINELTVGGVKIGSETGFTGISISGSSTSNHVTISDNDMVASGGVFANIIDSGLNARMSDGKVVAKNGLYIGYTGVKVDGATYENSSFAVNGENGSFKAANGKFTVSGSGAITADSLTLDENYNVKQNIEDAKGRITTVEGDLNTNQANLTALQGRVDGHDTEINTLKTKTEGITRVDGNSTTVDGVNFKEGAVVAAGVAANNITANNFVTVGNTTDGYVHITNAGIAVSGRLYSSLDPTATDLKSVSVEEMANTRDNTQKISYADDDRVLTDKATYIKGITHAGDVRLADGEVKAKRIVLEEEFANGTAAQATLTRESIVNLHGMIDGTTKIKVADGSEVGGVTFVQGKVTNVVSINDNLKFESDGIYLNKGDSQKQIKFSNDGKIIIGTSSSAYDTNGFYAGGDDYDAAKAGMKSDGSLKATGFTVDGATGNTTVGGDLTVNGAATFTKETAFANGIKTDKISEKNDGKGVTVDGVVLKDGGITADGNVTTTGDIQGKDINATGALKGQTLGIGTNGSEFTVDANGNAAVGGTLDVTGKTTLKNELQVNEKATFGIAIGSQTVINGGDITATGKLTSKSASIGTVGITDTGVVTGITKLTAKELDVTDSLNIAGDIAGSTLKGNSLKITGDATIGGGLAVTGNITGAKINGAAITETSFNGAQISTNKFNGVTLETNGNVTGGTITGTTVMDGAGASMNAGTVTGTTITDGNGFTATGGNVVAKKITADTAIIAGVNFAAGGSVSGISELTATTIKDGAGTIITGGKVESKTAKIGAINIDNETIEGSFANGLSIEGVKIKDGVMSAVVSIDANKATIGGVNTLDNTGLTVKTGSKVQVGTNTVIEDGSVKVSQKTSLTDQSLQLNDTNKWTQTGGLVADKATVNGIALGTDSKGKATFSDAAGKTTTIDGDKITTGTITADKLLIDKISLGKDGSDNISIDKDGDVTTKGDVTVKGADDDTTVIDGAKATFGKDAANQTTIDKGKIKAKAEDNSHQQAGLTFNENGLTVSGQNAEGKTSSFSFNAKTGANTFTGQDGTFTTINGSSVRSYNSATGAGHLNGATLNLWKDNDNSTYMTAGGATFNGAAGEKGGKTTTINGGTITTDTLNVDHINLGGEMVDKNGTTFGSNLSMDNQGNFSAAGGNFTVKGGTGADKGAFTNKVGNTTLKTDNAGASMSYDNTAATGGVKSNVSVGNNNANVSAGAGSIDVTNESITSKVTDNATSTITKDSIVDKVGNNSVTTDANGTTFANGGSKTTNINGGTITTGKLITDELVITGKGDAAGDGSGSLAFGGNGTIKSDVKEAGSAKNTQFTTNIDGVNTKVTDGTTTTENKVTAAGNSNTVTKDEKHKSEFNQGLTSIGGVVTNGEIKVAQKLDGATGLLTNEVTNADGKWSKLEQNGTGLTYTDSANPGNATRINSSDVSIGSKENEKDRINLSDLGQIDNLDSELTGRDEYKNNSTAVGGINAEAAIRREEVARLDGRINDVNDRVNKVGAMAAAIASLKSIGYDPQAPSEFSIGLGQYKGETGVAMGFFHYPNKNFMINVSLSTAGGETMGGIGATWRFGHKSPQKLLEEQREEQAKKELAAAEKYQAAAKLAKEAQERAEYAAKLARQAQVSADNAKAAADATQAKHFG